MKMAERRFVNLRELLDQLGYRQLLCIESQPLVEKLLSDLVHTTESLRNAKLSEGKTDKRSRNFDALLESYKAKYARVVRENNELHKELLKIKKEKDLVTRELKTHIRKLDHETIDLKFFNNQHVHKVRCLEKDGKAKGERIRQLELTEKEMERNITNNKLISHLNLQIEYLQKTNRKLEQTVEGLQQKEKDAATEVANLTLKNLELCEELTHIDDVANRLERLEQDEKRERLVNFLKEENIRLQGRIERVMGANKDLVLELETMKAKCGVCGRERWPSRLDAFVKSLEEERDHYRQEAERYKRARGAGGLDLSPSRSPGRSRSPWSKVTKERVTETELLHLENAVKSLERERLDLWSQVCLLKENREAVEEELKVRSAAVVQNAEKVAQLRAESNAFRLLQEQTEQTLSDTQHRLSVKINEVHAAHEQIENLEDRIEEPSHQGSKHKGDVVALHQLISTLDRQKDSLQDEVDQKTEQLVVLQEENSKKEQTINEGRLKVTFLENSLALLQQELNSRKGKMTSLRRPLDAGQEEQAALRRVTVRANRRLQDYLPTMTTQSHSKM